MTKLQQMMQQLQNKVIAQDYYSMLYIHCLSKHEMSPIGVINADYSDAKIINMANDFWLALPDTPEIQRGPFWLLCDIAEHVFGGDEDE